MPRGAKKKSKTSEQAKRLIAAADGCDTVETFKTWTRR